MPDKVLSLTEEAYQKFPDSWNFVQAKAYIEFYANRNFELAAIVLEKFLKKNTLNLAFTSLASTYLQASKIEKWEETYTRLLEFYPASTGFYYQMGNTYYGLRNYPKAEEYLIKAIEICPNSDLYWGKLAEIFRSTARNDKAIEAYEIALQYNPSYYEAREKIRELKGEKSIFSYFESLDVDSLIKIAPAAGDYPDAGAVILLHDLKRVVYRGGSSESTEEILVKVFKYASGSTKCHCIIQMTYFFRTSLKS